MLEKAGHTVTVVDNGREALAAAPAMTRRSRPVARRALEGHVAAIVTILEPIEREAGPLVDVLGTREAGSTCVS